MATPLTMTVVGVFNGGATKNTTLNVTGFADLTGAGTSVGIYDGTTLLTTAVVGSNGRWSATISLSGEGAHVLKAIDASLSGSAGTSNPYTVTLDTIPPVVAINGTGATTNVPLQTIAGTASGAPVGATVSLYDGANLAGTTSVGADGHWSTTVALAGSGSHTVTAKVTDLAGNVGISAPVVFDVGTISGFTVETGRGTTIAYPGATSTMLYGVNAQGAYVGTYTTLTETRAFSYDAGLNTYFDVPFPAGSTSVQISGIGGSGAAYGTFTDASGTLHAFTFEPSGHTFRDIAPFFGPPFTPGSQTISIAGVTASGDLYGFYGDFSNQTAFAYRGDTQSISTIFLNTGGFGSGPPSQLALSSSGLFYGNVNGAPFLFDTTTNLQISPNFPGAGSFASFTVDGVSTQGIVFGGFNDASNFRHAFIFDPVTQAVTEIAPAAADFLSTSVYGVTPTGIVWGSYTIGGSPRSFFYDKAQASYEDLDIPGAVGAITLSGANSSGLVYGSYHDAANAQHFFVHDPATQTTTPVTGPGGDPTSLLFGLSDSGIAFGLFDNGSKSYILDLATGVYSTLSDPSLPAGSRLTVRGIDPTGLVHGDYVDALGLIRPFTYDPATQSLGHPAGLYASGYLSTLGYGAGGQLFGNHSVGSTSEGFIYRPGDGVLHAGETAYFTVAVNNEMLTVAPGTALILSNGATATYDPAHSSSRALVFSYTPAPGPSGDTADLQITGFTGSVLDSAGHSVSLTPFVVTDTHLSVSANVVTTLELDVTSTTTLTNNPTQIISGTIDLADAGRTVSIFDGTVNVANVVSASDGSWSASVTLSGDGAHSIVAKATDSNGILISSAPLSITLDTHGPQVAMTSPGGQVLQAAQTISGTIGLQDAGRTVSVYEGASLLGSTVSNPDGTWSLSVTLSGNGQHVLTARAADALGNLGESPSTTLELNAPPTQVSLATAFLDVVEGQIAHVDISRTGDFSVPLVVYVSLFASGFAGAGSIPSAPIAVNFAAGATTAALDIAVPSDAVVDTTPGIINVQINFSPDYQVSQGNFTINVHDDDGGEPPFVAGTQFSTGPSVTGAGPSDLHLADVDQDGKLDAILVDRDAEVVSIRKGNGDGSFQAAQSYGVGLSSFGAVADVNGDGKLDVVVVPQDGSATAKILTGLGNGTFSAPTTVATGAAPLAVVAGDINSDGLTDLLVSSNGAISVLRSLGGGAFAPVTTISTGNLQPASSAWSLALADINGDSHVDIVASVPISDSIAIFSGDGLGGFSAPTLQAVAGNPHRLALADFNGDGRTDIAVASSLENAITIFLTGSGGVLGTPQIVASGVTPTELLAGDVNADGFIDLITNAAPNRVSVLLGDGAGHFAAPTSYTGNNGEFVRALALGDLNGDGQPDIAASFLNPGNLAANRLQILLNKADIDPPALAITSRAGLTNQPLATITGTVSDGKTAAANMMVSIYEGNTLLATAIPSADGRWTATVIFTGDGDHLLTAQATDAVGNIGTSTPALFTFDSNAPTVTITSAGGLTNVSAPTVTGTVDGANGGATVSLYDGTTLLGTGTVGPDGSWSIPVALSVDGAHELTAKVIANNGHLGISAPLDLVLDTQPAVLNITTPGGLTGQAVSNVSGTIGAADAGATVSLYDGSLLIGTALSNASGQWTATGVNLGADGTHTITAKATDAAGNLGVSSPVVITLDTTAPHVAITTPGGATNQASKTITGTADVSEAGRTVSVWEGLQQLASTTVAADGTWSVTTPLSSDGAHVLTARVTDAAGNTGTSAAATFVRDTVAPVAPNLALQSDTGLSASDHITNNGALAVTSLEPNATLQYSTDNGATWSAAFGPSEGANTVYVRQIDAAGNASTASPALSFTLDTAAPVLSITSPSGLVGNATHTIVGTISAEDSGQSISLYDGAALVATTTANPQGLWSANLDLSGDGPHILTARASDVAGNTSTSAPAPLNLDTTPPTVTIARIGNANQPVGSSLQYLVTFSEAVTGVDASAFALAGTNPTASIVSVIGSGATYTVTVNPGTASGTVELDISGAKILDLAGNALTGVYAGGTRLEAGFAPKSALVVDLNGDGHLDILTANVVGGQLSLLRGTGNGTFLPETVITSATPASAIAVADLNGDGKLDIVAANANDTGNFALVGSTVSVILAGANGSFLAPSTHAVGIGPSAVALGDVNGDGKLDVVVANTLENSVSVLLGNGLGGFAAHVDRATGTAPDGIVVADLDQDGRLDIVTSNSTANSLSILYGLGAGAFATQTELPTTPSPAWITAADVNGDGKLDLITGSQDSDIVSVQLAGDLRSYGTAHALSLGSGTPLTGLTVADVNRDGKLDIVGLTFGNHLAVINGKGDGTFGTAHTVSVAATGIASSITTADLNSDGRLDAIITDQYLQGGVLIHLNTPQTQAGPQFALGAPLISAPVLAAGSNAVAIPNGAASQNPAPSFKIDFLVGVSAGDTLELLLNGAPLTHSVTHQVSAADVLAGHVTLPVTSGDLGADGSKSISARITNAAADTATTSSFNYQFDTTPPALAVDIPTAPIGNRLHTFTGSLGAGDAGRPVSLYEGTTLVAQTTARADGTWSADVLFTSNGTHTLKAVASDAVGNSTQTSPFDVIVDTQAPTATITTVGANRQGLNGDLQFAITFSEPVTGVDASAFRLLGTSQGASIVSVTGSGADYTVNVHGGTTPGSISIDLVGLNIRDSAGNGFASLYGPVRSLDLGAGPQAIATADFNNDGRLDIIATEATSNDAIGVLRGGANGTFLTQITTDVHGTDPIGLAIADFNGDGNKDVAVANSGSNSVSVLRGTGTGLFVGTAFIVIDDQPTAIAAADINGDGKVDIVSTSAAANTVSLMLGNGNGTFQTRTVLATGEKPLAVVLADLDGDGKQDLITAQNVGNTISIWRGQGDGTFAVPVSLGVDAPQSLTTADINADGKLDLITTSTSGLSVFLGAGDGTFANPLSFETGGDAAAAAFADLNGDGHIDAVVANPSHNAISLLLGDGTGQFSAPVLVSAGEAPIAVTLFDANGDGRVDIATANSALSNSGSLLLQQPSVQHGPTFTLVGAPVAAQPVLDPASDSGVPSDNTTNVTSPTFKVAFIDGVEAGHTVQLLIGGVPAAHNVSHVVTASDVAAGFATLTIASGDLGVDGAKQISARISDTFGQSTTTTAVALTLDTTAPALTFTTAGRLTNSPVQTLSGTIGAADAAQTVSIYEGATLLAQTTPSASGAWSAAVALVGDGGHNLIAKATDAAGNSVSTAAVHFDLDTSIPSTPSIALVSDTGVSGDAITSNATTVVSGRDPNTTLQYSVNGGTSWTSAFTPIQGVNTVLVRQVNAAGTPSAASPALQFTFDSAAPVAPGFALTSDTGISNTDKISQNVQLTLSFVENGALVEYSTDNGAHWATSFTAVEGVNSVRVRQTDVAGNTSGASSLFTFTRDVTAPVQPTITPASGPINTATKTISGTGEVGSTIAVLEGNAVRATATVDASGVWSASVTFTGDGTHSLIARATDAAGNAASSPATAFLLDAFPPAVAITSPPRLTNQPQQTLQGTGEAGATLAILDGSTVIATTTIPQSGVWSVPVTLSGQGAHNLAARATDAAGNSASTTPVAFTLDTTPPALAITTAGKLTNTATQTISGTISTGDAAQSIAIYEGTTQIATASANASGIWSTTVQLASDGGHDLYAKATDAAGNTATTSAIHFDLDRSVPATPSLALLNDTGIAGDKLTSDARVVVTGQVANTTLQYSIDGGATWAAAFTAAQGANSLLVRQVNAAGTPSAASSALNFTFDNSIPLAPTLSLASDTGISTSDKITTSGILITNGIEPGAKAEYSADGGATWKSSFTTVEGANSVRVHQIDAAGNTSLPSDPFTFTLDTTAPPASSISAAPGPSSATTRTITGVAEIGSTIQVLEGTEVKATTTVNSFGTWGANVVVSTDGAHTLTARSIDTAGNASTSGPVSLILDRTAPTATITGIGSDTVAVGTPLQFAVTLSEDVRNVTAASFSLSGTLGGATITGVSGTGASYVVTANPGSGSGTVALNLTGGGVTDLAGNAIKGMSFHPIQSLSTSSGYSTHLEIADLNRDGKNDLFHASTYYNYYNYYSYYYSNSQTVYLGNGAGTVSTPIYSSFASEISNVSTVADVTGDGIADIISSRSSGVYISAGRGNGLFDAAVLAAQPGGGWANFVVQDLNGDAKPDIVGIAGSNLRALINNGNNNFSLTQISTLPVSASDVTGGDFNGDGKMDLAIANYLAPQVLLGNGDGSFGSAVALSSPLSGVRSVASADINRDGILDLVASNEFRGLTVHLGNGNGTFKTPTTYATSDIAWSEIKITDVNGDGALDVIAPLYSGISIFQGNGDGTLKAPISVYVPNASYGPALAVGDLNGDGLPEIAARDASWGSTITILGNDSSTVRGPAFTVVAPQVSGTAVDGYISGATVFADANENGVWDAGEAIGTTDAQGRYQLTNAYGPIVLTGGTDTTTGLSFTGRMTAPAGYEIVSPLTTLIDALIPAEADAATIAAAEQTVLSAFGITLSAGQTLATLDPQAGAVAGDPTATALYIAGAAVYDTITLLAATLASAKGTTADETESAVISALASTIAAGNGSPVDLTSADTLAPITQAASGFVDPLNETPIESTVYVSNVATVVAASNAKLIDEATAAADPIASVAANQTISQNDTARLIADTSTVSVPVAPPSLSLVADTGSSQTDGLTRIGTLSIGGFITAAKVEYSRDGGTTWTPTFTPVQGSNTVIARQTDIAGRTSEASQPFSFTYDSVAPALAVTTANATVRQTSQTIQGTGEAGAGIEILEDSQPVITAVIDSNGHWTADATLSGTGLHSFTVRATDAAGNTTTVAGPGLTLDTNDALTGTVSISSFLTNANGTVTLTATNALFDADSFTAPIAYRWQSATPGGEWLNIANGTSATLTPSAALVGKSLRVVATATDAFGSTDVASVQTAIVGNASANTIAGTQSAELLLALAGNDTLIGTAADTLAGGRGDDVYILSDRTSTVIERANEGIDTIRSSVTLTLATNVENLVIIGTGTVGGTGNALANTITAGVGANALDGGAGIDTLSYTTSNKAVSVTLRDTATALVAGGAAGDTARNFENVTGSRLADVLVGNASANELTGGAGADTLIGGGGNDRLIGDLGRDVMTGGTGSDIFDLDVVGDIGKGTTRDVILDFTHLADDIDVSTIDANGSAKGDTAFTLLAKAGAAFTGAKGQLRWSQVDVRDNKSDKTIIEGDINGDKIADFQIELKGLKVLTIMDFIL